MFAFRLYALPLSIAMHCLVVLGQVLAVWGFSHHRDHHLNHAMAVQTGAAVAYVVAVLLAAVFAWAAANDFATLLSLPRTPWRTESYPQWRQYWQRRTIICGFCSAGAAGLFALSGVVGSLWYGLSPASPVLAVLAAGSQLGILVTSRGRLQNKYENEKQD